MMEDERRLAYAGAFIAQARSDWDAYHLLEQGNLLGEGRRLYLAVDGSADWSR